MKQTHGIKLAESLSPITKKLDESAKKINEAINPSNSENKNNQEIVPVEDSEDETIDNKIGIKALPNSLKFSNLMKNTICKLMSRKNSFKIDQDVRTGGASINEKPVLILGGDSWKIGDNVYEITPEIHKALSSTGYTGETMKNEYDILMMNNNLRDVNCTGIETDHQTEKPSLQKNFLEGSMKFKTKLSMNFIYKAKDLKLFYLQTLLISTPDLKSY